MCDKGPRVLVATVNDEYWWILIDWSLIDIDQWPAVDPPVFRVNYYLLDNYNFIGKLKRFSNPRNLPKPIPTSIGTRTIMMTCVRGFFWWNYDIIMAILSRSTECGVATIYWWLNYTTSTTKNILMAYMVRKICFMSIGKSNYLNEIWGWSNDEPILKST